MTLHNPSGSRFDSDTIDFAAVVSVLWRERLRIALFTGLATALAVAAIYQLKPHYAAEAIVMADYKKPNLAVSPINMTETTSDPETAVLDEVQVLSSKSLAQQVITELRLEKDPEFNPTLRRPGPVSAKIAEWNADLRRLVGLERKDIASVTPLIVVEQRFSEALSVAQVGKSRAIRIQFGSTSPTKAATVANTLVDLYQANQVGRKLTAAANADEWLQRHVDAWKRQTEDAIMKVESYRSSKGLLRGRESTVVAEQITNMNLQLIEAQAKLGQAEARLNAAKQAASAPALASSTAEVLQSKTIQNLKDEQTKLKQQIAALSLKYADNALSLVSVRNQLAVVEQAINKETGIIIDELTADYMLQRNAVEAMKKKLDELVDQARKQNAASPELATLDWQAQADDAIYRNILSRTKELQLVTAELQPDSIIISRADVPIKPYFPNKPLLSFLSFVIATSCSIALVLSSNKKDKTINSTLQAELLLDHKALGLIPTIKGIKNFRDTYRTVVEQSPRSPFGRAIRDLHIRISATASAPYRKIMVASALPGEGKSTTALALATLLAETGSRTVLIDADLHHPTIHQLFGIPPQDGLADFLMGTSEQAPILHRDNRTGVSVISAGIETFHPGHLLSSRRMAMLLDRLGREFDTVIIDSPPVIAAPDALVLAPLVDATLFVVWWGHTPPDIATRASRELVATGAKLAGTALSKVDMDQMLRDGSEVYARREVLTYYRRAS